MIHRGERQIPLTPTERRLVGYLASRPGEVVSREDLLVHVWEVHPASQTRAVDATISRLRDKIERDRHAPEHLKTVYGAGYQLVLPETAWAPPPDRAAFGRERHLPHLGRLVAANALVTLTGLPGVGKSHLARTWLASQAGERPVFVDDADADAVRDLLAEGARVLATARAPLALPQETALAVDPLSPSASFAMLRALGAAVGWQPSTEEEIAAARDLVAHLGFLPGPITAVSRHLAIADARALREDLLVRDSALTGEVSAPLAAYLVQAHSPSTRDTLATIAAMPDGVPMDTLRALRPHPTLVDELMLLFQSALVHRLGQSTYRASTLVRHAAALAEPDRIDAALGAHVDRLVTRLLPRLDGPPAPGDLDESEREEALWLEAWRWALARPKRAEAAEVLALSLGRLFHARGEEARVADILLQTLQGTPPGPLTGRLRLRLGASELRLGRAEGEQRLREALDEPSPCLRGYAAALLALRAVSTSAPEQATAHRECAQACLPDVPPWWHGRILRALGWGLAREGRYAESIEAMERAVADFRLTRATDQEARTAARLGWVYIEVGNYAAARRHLHRARSLALRQQWVSSDDASLSLAILCHDEGELTEAESLLREAIGEARDSGAPTTHLASNLGWVLVETGAHDEAEHLLLDASTTWEAAGHDSNRAIALVNLALLCEWRGQREDAVAHLEAIARDELPGPVRGSVLAHLGALHARAGELSQAARHLATAEQLAERLEDATFDALVATRAAHLALARGESWESVRARCPWMVDVDGIRGSDLRVVAKLLRRAVEA
ncbi:MAG: hypothetical protein EP330_10900 [Deltaproteobacteria bacterium]|nr:MAG: hypothetical protein EP330_10900 [Deltaproteobacteria bacterium]